jgi:hypothetical protein
MPPEEEAGSPTDARLGQLVNDMTAATFGFGGKDVFDETYRKALKLDTSRFCTNFSPYEVGIIDVISQMLLPYIWRGHSRSVKAELYKLNVGCLFVATR